MLLSFFKSLCFNLFVKINKKIILKDKYKDLYFKKEDNINSYTLKNEKILKNFKKISSEYLIECEKFIKNSLNNVPKNQNSVYINNLNSNFFDANNPLLKIALDEEILNLVENYFNERAIIWDLRIIKSENNINLKLNKDQLWHRDKYDNKSLRLWLSLSDCDINCGPFQFLPHDISKKIIKSYITRVDDNYIIKKKLFNNIQYLLTKKGDISLIDVSKLLHCGSRIKAGKSRLIFNVIYTTAKPYKKPTFNLKLKNDLLTYMNLSNLQKSFLTY